MLDAMAYWTLIGNTPVINTSLESLLHRSCPHCSNGPSRTFHVGKPCPHIMSIEYFQMGSIRQVNFWPEDHHG